MSASVKLRWKKYVNELRFIHDEKEFTQELCKTAAAEFQIYYEEFCQKNQIDLSQLNEKHAESIRELYTPTPQQNNADPEPDSNCDGALVLHDSDPSETINSDPTEQESDYQATKDEQEIHEAFNKLFRKLAMLLHPDKLSTDLKTEERDEKLKMFKEAKIALESKRYFVLLDIAERLGISTPRNYHQQIRWMKKEIQKLNESVRKSKDTYNYLFAECETDEDRDRLIKRFMHQIFGPKIFQQ